MTLDPYYSLSLIFTILHLFLFTMSQSILKTTCVLCCSTKSTVFTYTFHISDNYCKSYSVHILIISPSHILLQHTPSKVNYKNLFKSRRHNCYKLEKNFSIPLKGPWFVSEVSSGYRPVMYEVAALFYNSLHVIGLVEFTLL